jgi:hypothetical protein
MKQIFATLCLVCCLLTCYAFFFDAYTCQSLNHPQNYNHPYPPYHQDCYIRNEISEILDYLNYTVGVEIGVQKGQNSLKPHISMRIILPTDDHLLESLVAKPVGCSGENGLERTEDLRWDDFSHVKSCSEFLPFTFEVDDIDLVRHCFKSQVRFVDKRTSLDNHKHLHGAGDKIIHCKGNGCTNEIIFSVEQQQDYQKKGWVEPKYCKACKLQRK